MKRILFVCLLLPFIGCSPALAHSPTELACVNEINRVRSERGLPTLAILDCLHGDARKSAEVQHQRRNVGHFVGLRSPDGFGGCGEICASGDGVSHVVRMWLNSTDHRNIMLSQTKTHIAVGNSGRYFAARLVGAPRVYSYSKPTYRKRWLFR